MDAISFVLGIKSSHLRSAHLKDLVYRGRVLRTSKINEDGSATTNGVNGHANGDVEIGEGVNGTQERNDPKSAWVMAVYEDDAGDEQLWKRTITNQGASEYRINDRIVTAQQYNEALEAENILIKARNFLVFQGDVESIASQSPRDLTRLIEQISGSLEYKAEYEQFKEAQETALEHQSYALNRRRGINSEIKQYTDQKNEADSYKRKADERDRAIVTHILWKLHHFQRTIEESGAEIQKHHEELKEHKRIADSYNKTLDDARKEQAKAAREVSKVEKSIKEKEKDIETRENGLVPITEKIEITKKNLTNYQTRVSAIAKERDKHSDTANKLSNDLKTVGKAQKDWEKKFKQRTSQEGRELSDDDQQLYNKLRDSVNKSTSADQTQLDNLIRQQKADEETVRILKSGVDNAEYRVRRSEDDITQINERKSEVDEQIKQTTKDMNARKKSLNEKTSERLRSSQLRTEKDEQLKEVLNKLIEADDGRKQSEKEVRLRATVSDLKRMFPGVRGRVSELGKPSEKRFQTAVSTVYGRNFDAVIVENEKTALECIDFLKQQRRGQATFIPLDTIQFTAASSSIRGQHRGCRMALDTINYERSLERAFSYVCGNAVVCDTVQIAKTVCWEKRNDVKAVTLDGTVIHKSGNMTGGSGGKQDSRRWEDSEVDNLHRLREKLQSEIASLPSPHRGSAEEDNLQAELVGLESKMTYHREESKALERNKHDKQSTLTHDKQELKTAKPKYEQKLKEFQSLEKSRNKYQDAISKVQDNVFRDFCRRLGYQDIRDYEAQQGSIQQEGAQKKLEFSTQKSVLESRMNLERQQVQEIQTRIDVLERRAQQDEQHIQELQTERDSLQNSIDEMNVEYDQLAADLEQAKENHSRKMEVVAEQRREAQKESKKAEARFKAIADLEAERQLKASSRYTLLRRCKLEDIKIPLLEDSRKLDHLPLENIEQTDPDAMDVDEDQDVTVLEPSDIQDYGILPDFDGLDEDLREVRHLLFRSRRAHS